MHLSITSNSVINCQLFPAQRQDCKTIEQLWPDWPLDKIGFVVADKGYDSGDIRNFIKSKNAAPVSSIQRALFGSPSGARYWLRRIGFSYKKKAFTYM